MKQKDVTVGMVCLTKICGGLVRVRVLQEVIDYRRTYGIIPKDVRKVTFRVQRVDNGKVLPKTRTAAALRPWPKKAVQDEAPVAVEDKPQQEANQQEAKT